MNILSIFGKINTFIFDIDGVLTDGTLWVLSEEVLARRMNIKDGYALQLAVKKGYRVIVISGGYSKEVEMRLIKLGISEVWMNIKDKLAFIQQYSSPAKIDLDTSIYMGDDLPDLLPMKKVFLPCCPKDAVAEIKDISKYISPYNGGECCVRDVIEKVLKLNNHWLINSETGAI